MSRAGAPRGGPGLGLVGALVGAALLVALGETSFGARLSEALARSGAPARALGSEKLRRALVRSERLALVPPVSGAPRGSGLATSAVRDSGRCDGALLGSRPPAPAAMPSSLAAPPRWRDGAAPLLSLWVEPCRLERLEARPEERGRAWEEIGWLSQFEKGELRFATPVGVRIHGGESRGRRPSSYRLLFRDSLGARPFPAELLAPGLEGTLDTLIADANAGSSRDGVRWQFLDAIAFDVARRLGADAPLARPARLSVNGAEPEVYVLIERIDAGSFARRHGHRELALVRGKLDAGAAEEPARAELRRRIDSFPSPLTPAAAGELFELDSLVDGFVTALYCASGDLFQAALVRDPRGNVAGGRWRFVPWDLDQSFRDPKGMSRFRRERDVLAWTLHRAEHDVPLAGRLLRRLLKESGEARRGLAQRTTDALNHQLTPAFAAEIVARYRAVAEELAVHDLRFLDQLDRFLAERPAAIHAELERFLDVGAPVTVAIDAPAGALEIDGFAAELPYRGRYPRGTMVALDVTPPWRPLLLGFRVDGTMHLVPSGRLELEVRQAMRIEPLFESGGAPSYGSRSTG